MAKGSRASAGAVASFASLASYRTRTMRAVMAEMGDELTVFAGTPAPDVATRLVDYDALGIRTLRNRYVLGGRVTIQNSPIRALLGAQVALVDLNPRMVLNWPILLIRRLLGRPTLVWGHAWPRQGRGSRTDTVRGWMRRLANGVITYTESQAEELRQIYPGKPITAAPNALYYRDEFAETSNEGERDAIIYVGRLVAEKKPALLVEAFNVVAATHPRIRLSIVGDGKDSDLITHLVSRSPFRERITMHGHCEDASELQRLYSAAVLSVSPGYVGLAATQSFAMGVPMVIARDEPHAPEIEAAVEGVNALFFREDDAVDLARVIGSMLDDSGSWEQRRGEIQRRCQNRYSVEAMASGLVTAIRGMA
ncbi:glycosyltransferase family 4 protein [uncultured Cellulomonas sp.]|uniref:glycosyltransferase family 4 protein n=1 Tax=uncultured Cellulomonas sp. TaxID=189682 RepID=UPI0028E9F24A|nr:glycosyltransferase family 4 protein [uncultured Cellulomonas sp.]